VEGFGKIKKGQVLGLKRYDFFLFVSRVVSLMLGG
jgi:hypothetical protein